MKLLFLDSNILLNFYDFHDEDLDQLNKLADLIDSGDIKLFLTTQVQHEVMKNRDNRLGQAYKKFTEYTSAVPMPVFCKSYKEYADINRAQKVLNGLKSKLSKTINNDIQSKQLKADIVIETLKEKSILIESDKYLHLAVERHRLGRPPGKKDRSFGDEINWESLLAEVTEEGDFIIVSTDGDYSSAINKDELKDYLVDEWHKKKTSEIYFYHRLTSFFTEHDIKIEFKIEEEKNSLIEDLINSENFLSTHGIISRLNKYASFSDEQLAGLVTALLNNQQVNWIASDSDINKFYLNHLQDKSEKFDIEIWKQVGDYIWPKEEDRINLDQEILALEEKSSFIEDKETDQGSDSSKI
ncbi:MAG: PIN domain-containing protein [Patescibacteria group bacterium]